MSSVTDAPLERLLREADPETAAAFVADLFAARGYAVDRVGDQRIVVESDGETSTIAICHPDGEGIDGDGEIDRVVAIDGTDWRGAADGMTVRTLQRQLGYAVDRPVARTLLETHFDWTPDSDVGSSPPQTDTDGAAGAKSGPLHRSGQWRAVAVVVLVALLAGSAVALTGADGGFGDATNGPDGTTDDVAATPESNADADGSVSADATATATPVQSADSDDPAGDSELYEDAPPGIVGPDRVNINDAAGAFLNELDGESYTLQVSYAEYAASYPVGAHLETLRVESNDRYVVDVSRAGRTESRPLTVAGVEQYADGSVRYLRYRNGSVSAEQTTAYDPFMFNTTQYLGWLLSSKNSSIASRETRENTTIYRVLTEGDLDPRFDDAKGTLYITGDGLVEYARWEYRPADQPDLRVVFKMRVTEVGSTTVTRPDWVDNETVRRVDETGGTENETAGTANATNATTNATNAGE